MLLELVLHEGRKHIVRRALAEVGHPVQRLVRTAVGGAAAAVIGVYLLIRLLWFAYPLVIVTFLHLVVGEMAPKSWAIAHPETSATVLAIPMRGTRSLNLATAVGIVLFEAMRQQR
mgnify:CR=1 FL=1